LIQSSAFFDDLIRVHSVTSASSWLFDFGFAELAGFAVENEHVAFERGRFPGYLRAVRRQSDVEAHALQRVLDAGAAAAQFAHQVLGVKAVLTLAVGGDVARRGGVGEQAADRGIEL
jgi:hypothetical protein